MAVPGQAAQQLLMEIVPKYGIGGGKSNTAEGLGGSGEA